MPRPVRKMPLEEQVWLLSMVDILEPLSQEELEALARRVPDTYLDQGEILYPQMSDERLFLLKKGRVRVYRINPEGQELTLSVAEEGTVIGEMVFTNQLLVGTYLQALRPSVVVTLKRSELEQLILKNPEVGLRLVRLVSERLHYTETRLAELTYKEVPARLASLILRLIETEGVSTSENYKIPTRYTHDQLASMIGSKRVPVTRAFAKLKEAGALELRDRYIYVTDIEILKRAAEEK